MKISKTTNVKPSDLNYHRYTRSQYDRDIVCAIPAHKELHENLLKFLLNKYSPIQPLQILDLGAGTAITSALVRDKFSNATFDLVDFSKPMLAGAHQRMGNKKVNYIFGDFSLLKFDRIYDVVMTVIGLHHQTSIGTRRLFKKLSKQIRPGGLLVVGDLVTFADKHVAAFNNAKHYHHLVEHAVSNKVLTEWAYHHQFLNELKTIEDYRQWLNEAGFEVVYEFSHWNTALLIAQKANS